MYQVPMWVWRAIAKMGPPPETRWAKAMASAPEGVEALLKEVETEQAAEPNKVQVAFQALAPLLVERDRIAAYVRSKADPALLQVLLNLATPEEAAAVAEAEWRLTPEQQARLKSLLSRESEPSSRSPKQPAHKQP